MAEKHPFGDFVPSGAKYLILGSFVGKVEDGYNWFYGNRRNQFWAILMEVYKFDLSSKEKQQKFLSGMCIAMADVILECEREGGSNLDTKLKNLVFNFSGVREILENNEIEKIYFSSRFVENIYRRKFKSLLEEFEDIELLTLPSPSPRYAAIRREEKIKRYRQLMPKLP